MGVPVFYLLWESRISIISPPASHSEVKLSMFVSLVGWRSFNNISSFEFDRGGVASSMFVWHAFSLMLIMHGAIEARVVLEA